MSEPGCDILLYGTMSDIGPVVRDDLKGHGFDVVLVDFPQNTPRDFFGYSRGLLKAVDKYRPKTVMPVGASLAMARMAGELDTNTIVASADTIELLDSKVRTYELAQKLGIRQPGRFSFEEICSREESAPKDREDIGVIFKRDTSFGGSGVHRPRSVDSLRHLIEHENGTPYLIEEYIYGEDLSVDCIRMGEYFRGEAYISTGRIYTQGPSVERHGTDCPEAVKTAKTILDNLDYNGVCGLDFRRAPDGTLFLLECNPRFTGGIRTQIERGFDIPFILISHAV